MVRVDLQVVALVAIALLRQPSCPPTAAGVHEAHLDQFNFGPVQAQAMNRMLIADAARFQLEARSQKILEICFITMLPAHHHVKCRWRSCAPHEIDERWNQLRIAITGYLNKQAGGKIHLQFTWVGRARKYECSTSCTTFEAHWKCSYRKDYPAVCFDIGPGEIERFKLSSLCIFTVVADWRLSN